MALKSCENLPPLEDLAPDEESKQFIRERLSWQKPISPLEEAAEDIDDAAPLDIAMIRGARDA